jgi:hypothetical protein
MLGVFEPLLESNLILYTVQTNVFKINLIPASCLNEDSNIVCESVFVMESSSNKCSIRLITIIIGDGKFLKIIHDMLRRVERS